MGDRKGHDIAEIEQIEALLGVRQQITGWLERLDATSSRAPEAVRAKVRADYRARLAQVVVQLGTHGDLIASTLAGLRASAKEILRSRSEEFEIRSEAELRHTVGEYTDDEWQLVELESSGKIEQLDHELGRLSGEITRLEEVQALIMPAPARGAPAPSAETPTEREDIRVTHGHEIEMPPMLDPEPLSASEQPALTLVRDEGPLAPMSRPEAPRFVPRPGSPKSQAPARAIPFPQTGAGQQQTSQQTSQSTSGPVDELAFLRSVTLDAAPQQGKSTPQAAPSHTGPLDREDRASQMVARTLKCGECGSLNRPTEWYCEKCGAELATL